MDFSMLYTYCLYLLGKDTSVGKKMRNSPEYKKSFLLAGKQ